MVPVQLTSALRRLRSEATPPGPGDGELVRRFADGRDPEAFAALVERHGRLVWSVCRNVLGHDHDAEDAFQAVFLVLARDAASIRKAEALAGWLHGVAYRVAMRAKRDAARRRCHERQAAAPAHDRTVSEGAWRELQAALDEEVQGLPDRLRVPFVLCVLEGRSQAEAAAQLGWKASTLTARLSQARHELLRRLGRRGMSLSAVLSAVALSRESSSAAVPAALAHATLRVVQSHASAAGAGEAATTRAATLAEGVKPTMLLTKTKIGTALLLLVALLVTGTEWVSRYLIAAPPDAAPPRPASAKDDPADTFEVRGRVLDPAGKGVAGARLYWPSPLKETVTLKQRGRTDQDGRFKLRLPRKGLPRGSSTVLVAAADGFGLDWVELPPGGAPGEVMLRLVKDVPVRGRIVSTEGKPIPGVAVKVMHVIVPGKLDELLAALRRGNRAGETMPRKLLIMPLNGALHVTASDKEGRFTVSGAGGERLLWIEATHPGLAESRFIVVTRQGLDLKAINRAISSLGRGLDIPLRGPSFEHVAEPDRLIEGTVREAGTGKPVAGATVAVGGNTGSAVSDAHGRYRVRGLHRAQRYSLHVTPPKNTPLIGASASVAEGPARLEPLRADVELVRGVIVTGRVLDKLTGKGVESSVAFYPLPDNLFAKKAPRNLSMYTSTDPQGRFRLVSLPGPGVLTATVIGQRPTRKGVRLHPYPINVYKPAQLDAEERKRAQGFDADLSFFNACKVVDVKPDGMAGCTLTVDPGLTLTLRLEDPEGKPLAGVTAAGCTATSLGALKLETAACTVYALDPDRPRQLILLHRERQLVAVVTLRGDKGPRSVRLQPTGVVTGRLLDADGQPLAGVFIAALYRGETGRNLINELYRLSQPPQTDANGRFRLEGIVPGLKFDVGAAKGRRRLRLEGRAEVKPLEAGKVLDLGDLKASPEAK